jgi:GNAT superfamily N-acetyltransferase
MGDRAPTHSTRAREVARLRLVDVNAGTEGTFLRCLHDEAPDDPRVIDIRRRWVEENRAKGLRTKVLILDTGEVAGLCQYMPIEHSHFTGEGLMAIDCIWVHGYEHHIGNRQGNGYGRYILESIEEDARSSGALGVAAWGMDFPDWNPVSFYEHMGYERVEKAGLAVLVWKPFSDAALQPGFLRGGRRPAARDDKVSVAVFVNGFCTSACGQCIQAREAVDGLESIVDYLEVDTSNRDALLSWGISVGLFVDGKPHRSTEPPCTSEVLRSDILELAERKGLDRGAANE